MLTHLPNRVFNLSTVAFSLWNGNLAQYLWSMFLKSYVKVQLKWTQNDFKYYYSI